MFTFILGTMGCALSGALAILIAMRGLQGISASANMVMTAPLNRLLYPRSMLGRAIANNSLFVASGNAAGPTLGGIVLSVAPWPTLFWINVPILAIGLFFGLRYLPDSAGTRARVDILSVVLGAVSLCALVFGLQDITRHDKPAMIFTLIGAGALLLAAFIARQLRLAHPLLAVDLFRLPRVRLSALAASFSYVAFGAAFVALPFYLQRVMHYSPLETGLLLAPWPIATMFVTRIIGRLTDTYAPSVIGTIGLVGTASGLTLFAILPAHPIGLVIAGAITGASFGLFQTPNNYMIIGSTPPGETGRATGIITTVRTTSNTAGAALVAIAFDVAGVSSAGLWIAATSCAIGACISAVRIGPELRTRLSARTP
jgi:DHA2 family multidrug resistance protein-like MFS transporter